MAITNGDILLSVVRMLISCIYNRGGQFSIALFYETLENRPLSMNIAKGLGA